MKKRMCCGPESGFLEFQRHPFFKEIEWKKLEQMALKSPFQPDTDKANFERGPDLEEMFETETADLLKYRKRSIVDPTKLSPLHLQMENDYSDFNYERYNPNKPERLSTFDSYIQDVGDKATEEITFDPDENA